MTGMLARGRPVPFAALTLALVLGSCAAPSAGPLVDPFPPRFPLAEAGSMAIDGAVAGQPRARDAVVYFATRDGRLTAVVAPSRAALWRFQADGPLSAGPELGGDQVVIRDDAGTVYALDARRGALAFKRAVAGPVSTAVRGTEGRIFLGTANGVAMALDAANGGATLWETALGAAVTAGPVFDGPRVLFGCADGRLHALDAAGRPAWTFAARGAIRADPCAGGGRVFFGTEERLFYALDGATGRARWSRRLQGAPVHPPVFRGSRLVVAASNSVVHVLAARGGSVLSWEAVPSRIVHEPALSGPLVLVASGGPGLVGLDLATGRAAGRHAASGPLATGALWLSPEVVLVVEDSETGRQRLVFLRRDLPANPAAKVP